MEIELFEIRDFLAANHPFDQLPDPILDVIRTCAGAHPMQVLRTAVSALEGFEDGGDDTQAMIDKTIRLTAQVPMIIAATRRRSPGTGSARLPSRLVGQHRARTHRRCRAHRHRRNRSGNSPTTRSPRCPLS